MYRYVEVQAKACLQSDMQIFKRRNTILKRQHIFLKNMKIIVAYREVLWYDNSAVCGSISSADENKIKLLIIER